MQGLPRARRPLGKRKFVWNFAATAAAVMVAATVSSCASAPAAQSSAGAGTASSATPTAINAQLGWLKLTQFGGFFMADNQGFYADNGIKATFTAGGPNILAWQSITNGQAQVGDDDNTNVLVAISKGQPLVIIGAIFQTSPFAIISKAVKPISSIRDFKGKTIAVSDAGKPQIESLIKAAGISLSDVQLVPAGPDPSALVSGQVDGYFGYATSQGVALEEQGIQIHTLFLEDLGVPSYGNVIITTKDELAKNKDLLVRYMRASIKGYEYLNANPDTSVPIIVNDYGPPDLKESTELLTAKFQKPLIESPKGVLWVDKTKMKSIIDALVKAGTIPAGLNVDDIVDTSVLEAAYGGKTSLLN